MNENNTKIAFIDDDLADKLTWEDLKNSDIHDDILGRLDDDTDPTYEELATLLEKHHIDFNSHDETLDFITNPDFIQLIPKELADLIERAKNRRRDSAEPLVRIERWITELTNVEIKKFSSPVSFLAAGEDFDILLVDYLLVDDDETKTKEFIKKINGSKKGAPQPFLLMSSHGQKLKDDFITLKKELKMSSSRFRILEKPKNEESKHDWTHAISSLINEQPLIQPIEKFTADWGKRFAESARRMVDELWCLDAYSLSMFFQAANEDRIRFSEYFSEVVTRKLLSTFEDTEISQEPTSKLEEALSAAKEKIYPGIEIKESREIVRSWMNEICWHKDWLSKHGSISFKETYADTAFPGDSDEEKNKFTWISHQLAYGSVLQNKNGQFLVHLTQPCDSARLNYEEIESKYLFFLPGTKTPLANNEAQRNISSLSPSMQIDGGWTNVHWNLTNPISFSIKDLIDKIEDFKLVGRLRSDLSQKIITEYVSKISRIASIRTPNFYSIIGCVAESQKGSNQWVFNSEESVHAHLRQEEGDKWILESSPSEASKCLTGYNDWGFDERALVTSMCKGIQAGFDKKKSILQNSDLYFLILDPEVFSGPKSLEEGLNRVIREKPKKINPDPAKNQLIIVFAKS